MTLPLDSIDAFVRKLGNVALLTHDEEIELARRIEAGVYADYLLGQREHLGKPLGDEDQKDLREVQRDGEAASQRMVLANLRLVAKWAGRTANTSSIPFEDLMQTGTVGLMHAVEKFDYTQGKPFGPYAVRWIRESFGAAATNQGRSIYLPEHIIRSINAIYRARQAYRVVHNEDASIDQVADYTGLDGDTIRELDETRRRPISLDLPVGSDDGSPLGHYVVDSKLVGPEKAAEAADLRQIINGALSRLGERERAIIRMLHGFDDDNPKSLVEIGDRLGVTRQRIQQLRSRAMAYLQSTAVMKRLRAYFDDSE
jgi:RNA polymerase nonessential primary-like sigma factor